MSEKITLRLKSDPSVVLPEADGEYGSVGTPGWMLTFGDGAMHYFPSRFWEPVPPPYVLPTGIGAVVRSESGHVFIRVSPEASGFTWASRLTRWLSDEEVLRLGILTTLSEGVEL